ncbi:MAG TPA: hypothetical protein VF221_07690 [Chloroflexota bacterium]
MMIHRRPVVPRADHADRRTGSHVRPVVAGTALLMAFVVVATYLLVGRGVLNPLSAGTVPTRTVPWHGLPLTGHWHRTSLTVLTNALLGVRHRSAIVAATTDGMWRSSDGGRTWQRMGLKGRSLVSLAGSIQGDVVIAGSDDGTVYLGVREPASSWRWRRINVSWGAGHPVFSLALAPSGEVVLAGTFGSLYRGTRSGGYWSWQRVVRTHDDAAVTSLVWLPWAPQHAAGALFGVWPPALASADGGRTWERDGRGLPPTLPTQTLLPVSDPEGHMILTTMGGGVWRQDDRGTWHDFSAGLPERHAMPIVAQPIDRTTVFYAGTMGYGVYAKEGTSSWRRLGEGMEGGQYTALGMALVPRPHPSLLIATARGVYRYPVGLR